MNFLRYIFIAFFIIILHSCTCTVNLVNAAGEASDVVDDAASASAQIDPHW